MAAEGILQQLCKKISNKRHWIQTKAQDSSRKLLIPLLSKGQYAQDQPEESRTCVTPYHTKCLLKRTICRNQEAKIAISLWPPHTSPPKVYWNAHPQPCHWSSLRIPSSISSTYYTETVYELPIPCHYLHIMTSCSLHTCVFVRMCYLYITTSLPMGTYHVSTNEFNSCKRLPLHHLRTPNTPYKAPIPPINQPKGECNTTYTLLIDS